MSGPFASSDPVWLDLPLGQGGSWALFRRSFHLPSVPPSLPLHLFADTRYRLTVNGQTAHHGPGRFVTQHPEYDTVDLAPFLKEGENEILVEACFYGASSYQTMPDGKPGFLAAGGADGLDLATPGEWEGWTDPGRRTDAPPFSFAQGPVEIRDLRVQGSPCGLRVLTPEERPWGPFTPYSGTPLPLNVVLPKELSVAGTLADDWDIYGFTAGGKEGQGHWSAFAAWLWSPRAQEVTLSCYWTDLALNGKPVPASWQSPLGSHGTALLHLDEGWNVLAGELGALNPHWTCLVGFPRSAELQVKSRRSLDAPGALAVAPSGLRSGIFLPKPTDDQAPEGWTEIAASPLDVAPARLCGWDHLGDEGKDKVWTYLFHGGFHGHLCLDVEGPEGTILDVVVDDWQRDDGMAALYKSNPFIDSADRFILAGGRQVVELFHARGGKLAQVVLRPPAGEEVHLHGLWVRSRLVLRDPIPAFSCDVPAIEAAWNPSLLTLASSTDDAYADCPWRERSSYVGDSLVNFHLHLLLSPDLRAAKRTFQIFAQAQREDGQLPGCAPSWLREPHEDYTLQWILALRDYWAFTGDLAFVEENWPVVERIWASPTWQVHSSGLWSLLGKRAFIDWGCLKSEREGEAHAGINLLRLASARATSEMAMALGRAGQAETFAREARKVDRLLEEVLWSEEEGRLLPSLGADTLGLHTRVWTLAFGALSLEKRQRTLEGLEPWLLSNVQRGLDQGQFQGHLELFFLYFLLPALAELGRPDLAEEVLASHYGYVQQFEDDTLPECFCQVHQGGGSRCHSWSGAAAVYAARYVLGLRLKTPGDPDSFFFHPIVHGVTAAKGWLPHRLGRIEVEWEKGQEPIIRAPQGVSVASAPPEE